MFPNFFHPLLDKVSLNRFGREEKPDLLSISQSEALLGEIAEKIDPIRTLCAGHSHVARTHIVKAPLMIMACLLPNDIKAMRLTWSFREGKKQNEDIAIEH